MARTHNYPKNRKSRSWRDTGLTDINPGGPTDLELAIDPTDKEHEPPDAPFLPKAVRVWVEGQLTLSDWDIEGHTAKDQLRVLCRNLSGRLLENGVKDEISYLSMREQPLKDGEAPQYRYGRLSSRRYRVDEVHDYLIENPGVTVAEMAIGMFPDEAAPTVMEPRIRQYLHRLKIKNLVSQRRDPGNNVRYFPVYIDRIPRDWDSRRRALALELQDAWGGRVEDYLPLVQRLEKLMDGLAQRVIDPNAWEHHKDRAF